MKKKIIKFQSEQFDLKATIRVSLWKLNAMYAMAKEMVIRLFVCVGQA